MACLKTSYYQQVTDDILEERKFRVNSNRLF